jgi:hypothetical protein
MIFQVEEKYEKETGKIDQETGKIDQETGKIDQERLVKITDKTGKNYLSKSKEYTVNNKENNKVNNTVSNTPPNKTKSVFGYSVNKVEEWIDYMLIPEYQNPEHSTKRNEATINLFEAMNDVLSDDIDFDEFIRIYYPSLDNRYREMLKSIILNY